MVSLEQKCRECRWFEEDNRSPKEVAELLREISGHSTNDTLGDLRINQATKSGICLAAELPEPKITISSFRCSVTNDNGELQFTPTKTD